MKKRQELTAEQFIRVWQAAESVAEVGARTGYEGHVASVRAAQLRAKGVPLKRFTTSPGYRNDWAALAKLARSLNGKAKP